MKKNTIPKKHKCFSEDCLWLCSEDGLESGSLGLTVICGDVDAEGNGAAYSSTIKINYCPFCGYNPYEKKTMIKNCDKCSLEDHDGFFCKCEMRNIEVAKILRESGKSPWKNRSN